MNSRTSTENETVVTLRPQGADPLPAGGVRHRLWTPAAQSVEAVIFDPKGEGIRRAIPLEPESDGFFSIVDPGGAAGDLYKYRIDGDILPDPFSRWQPEEPSGPSMVIDPRAYSWKAKERIHFPLSESVIYELHVGTFTLDGTFRAAIARLDFLVELGITTIEIMPVAAFPGRRNWGYDGVMLFAPDSSYGHPDDFRALIDAAHERGLNVLLDVVYNHFGPDGNYLSRFSPHYFTSHFKTPWGDAINFSDEHSQPVRALFLANIVYWMEEFRLDGFRLDATHAIVDDSTPHILHKLAEAVHDRGGIVIAEDDRNLASLALPPDREGTGFDGLWADDFHHTVRVALTRQREGYFGNFDGSPEELVETLRNGWFFVGQTAPATKERRGSPTAELRLEQFVHCIVNHDQAGNQAFGERLNHLVSPAAYRAASALLCLTPGTPLLFMGQEWAASSPFLYFTEHHDELGKNVTEGRQREFKDFVEALPQGDNQKEIPDPQAELTFLQSKLQWDELSLPHHQQCLLLYRELLTLRRTTLDLRKRNRENLQVELLGNGIVGIRFSNILHTGLLALVDLHGGHEWEMIADPFAALPDGWAWDSVLSTNETRFGGDGSKAVHSPVTHFTFEQPELLLLKPVRKS